MKEFGGVLSYDRRPSKDEPSTSKAIERTSGEWSEELGTEFYASSSMAIPGKGEPGKNCGTYFPREFCDQCGEPHFGASVCEQRTCPDCSGMWARRRAEGITRRLGAARHVAEGMEKRAVHAVGSPPEGEIQTLTDVYSGFRDAYRRMEEQGVRGGTVIFHGFRVLDETKAMFEEAKERGKWETDRDGKLWAFVRSAETRRERGIGEGKEWRGLVYWSPHYHVIGLCEDFEANDPENQDGWVLERLSTLDDFEIDDREGYESMVRVSRYLLSHATFETETSKDCIRWFGELATTKFIPSEELSDEDLETIRETTEEVAGSHDDRGDGVDPWECVECGGHSSSSIFEAGGALLDEGWCSRIGREQERKLTVAFEWAIGDRPPPPGLKNPRTEEEAYEAFEELLD